MADNRLTKKRLKNHFAYNWWKYALSAAVSAMLVSIVFAVTAYRPPAEKKVELYVLNGYIDTETFQRDFWPELQARKPEQEELTVLNFGTELAKGKTAEVLHDPRVITAYIGEDE